MLLDCDMKPEQFNSTLVYPLNEEFELRLHAYSYFQYILSFIFLFFFLLPPVGAVKIYFFLFYLIVCSLHGCLKQ